MLTAPILDWLRANTKKEFQSDINLVSWLIKCEYLDEVKEQLTKEIKQGLLTSQKHKDELKFINFLIERKCTK